MAKKLRKNFASKLFSISLATDGVTTEKWIMNKGKLRIEGAAEEVVEEKKESRSIREMYGG